MVRRGKQLEYGDFQTPPNLAHAVVAVVSSHIAPPAALVEPTCGRGTLLVAALDVFPATAHVVGLDVNPEHVSACRQRLAQHAQRARVECGCFFATDWSGLLGELPSPLLVIGNPPWVTNSALGAIESRNLPEKVNARRARGIDAITGKSNFDISEWMLARLAEQLAGRDATLAMLCKRSVARRVLAETWRGQAGPERADFYPIDAARHFGAAVDAGLLLCRFRPGRAGSTCNLHRGLAANAPVTGRFGWCDGELVADVDAYHRHGELLGQGPRWRSGVKHDCSRVMELEREGQALRNGLGEVVDIESDYLYPMLKSSDIARGRQTHRYMVVTQRAPRDATEEIARTAPRTWEYLVSHAVLLDRRASAVYAGRPRFAVFGVGPYTFAPWKVAVSGFYKKARFAVVGPVDSRPVVLDDTCYFLACKSEVEARTLVAALESAPVRELMGALVFADAKRPITAGILGRIRLPSVE